MSPDYVKVMVQRIAEHESDFEVAHSLEDDLYRAVLSEIAKGRGRAARLASAALLSQMYDFPRYAA